MHAPAGCGLCCAVDRRFALHRALGCRAGADAGPAERDPLELPLRFHGELFGRAEGRERSDAMPERSIVAVLSSGCQQAVKAVMPAPAAKPPAPPVTAAPAAPARPLRLLRRRRLSLQHRRLPLLQLLLLPRPPTATNRRLLSHQRRKRRRHSRQPSSLQHRQRKALRDLQRAHHRPSPPRLR